MTTTRPDTTQPPPEATPPDTSARDTPPTDTAPAPASTPAGTDPAIADPVEAGRSAPAPGWAGLRAEIGRRAATRDQHRDATRVERAVQQAATAERRAVEGARRDARGAFRPGAGRLSHRMSLPAHTASSGVLKTWYPWSLDAGLGVPGAYIGVDLFSRASFLFDPFELYAAGVITSPNGVVVGEIGSGKSSLLKCLIIRLAAVGIPFSWTDIKGEYTPLADALGITPLRLAPGLGVRLNPLAAFRRHPSQTEQQWRAALVSRQSSLLEGLVEVRLGRPTSMTERTALELALATANGTLAGSARDTVTPVSLPTVVAHLAATDLWDTELRERGITAEELLRDSRDARLALHSLVTGPLAGMFDGEDDNTVLDFEALGTIIDLSEIRADQDVTVMAMVCAQSALEAELMRPDGGRRLVGYDEAWLPLGYLPLLRRFRAQWKLARLYGLCNIMAAHRFSDWDALGAAGSEATKLAKGLLEDTGFRVVARQVEASLAAARDMLGLSDVQTQLLRYLRKGSALWQVGAHPFVVQHVLSSHEYPLVQTDSRMQSTSGVDDVSDEDWEQLLDLATQAGLA